MSTRPLLFILVWSAAALSCWGQCRDGQIADSEKYRVRDVKVSALFGSVPKELKDQLAKHRNELFRTTSDSSDLSIGGPEPTLEKYKAEVRRYLEEKGTRLREGSYGVNQRAGVYVRATFETTCTVIVPPEECKENVVDEQGNPATKCVDITIKHRVVPINTSNPTANLLDLARSNQLRFFDALPRPLLAFDPTIGIEQDESYGTSITGSINTDLLTLPAKLTDDRLSSRRSSLLLSVQGRKSLTLPFYSGSANLAYLRSRPGETVAEISLGAGYSTEKDIRGEGTLSTEATAVRGDFQFNLGTPLVNQLSVGAGYRHRRSRFTGASGLVEHTVESGFTSRLLTDGKLGGGFLRTSLWIDHASISDRSASYTRLQAHMGYAGNIALPHQSCRVVTDDTGEHCVFAKSNAPILGLELSAGLGRTWGTVPQSTRFFGGNSTGNFLYDAPNQPSLVEPPTGPLIRSIGKNKAGAFSVANEVIGGTSYEYASLSISIPVKAWSRPLIPAIAIVDRGEEGTTCASCTSLKQILKNQVDKGKNIYIDAIASQRLTDEQRADLALDPDDGLTPEEQQRLDAAERAFEEQRIAVTPEADRLWQELTPTIAYIADKANLYSIKPLIMFDLARVYTDGDNGRLRVGVGGGVQLNVVIAKFEVGYVRAVRKLPTDANGNFVVRMVFEKLF